jgi:hypothetical protein
LKLGLTKSIIRFNIIIMNLYTEVLNALKIVNDPREDSLDRMLKHEDLVKIKRLLDGQLTRKFPVDGKQT